LYKAVLRPLLFLIDPERSHNFTLQLLKIIFHFPGVSSLSRFIYNYKNPKLSRNVFGLDFKNPVGLAAGFDKDAKFVEELSSFGFGFIEVGTLTPQPQVGFTKPRLFRLKNDNALINRMGFNNQGVIDAVKRLRNCTSDIIIGGNISKNKETPNQNAVEDYEYCFEALFEVVDYFVVNVSSPNTPDLRELQDKEPLMRLLTRMKERVEEKKIRKPILLKIAPDLNLKQLDDIIEIASYTKIDGIIATNTTIARENLITPRKKVDKIGQGGLSGKPLKQKSLEVIAYLFKNLNDKIPIIGVGGISSPNDAIEILKAGASLVQIYTGFIYQGPSFIKKINKTIAKLSL